MTDVEVFPSDPFTPSLRYAATCLVPITVPWAHEPVKLGTPLSISQNSKTKSEFLDGKSAFSMASLKKSKLVFTSGSGGDVKDSNTSGSASSSEHVDASVAASIGGKWLGASGRVKYEKNVKNDGSSIQSSFRTTYRSGKVTFLEVPRLSSEAVKLLQSPNRPQEAFKKVFGEYYVAAYFLGGSNANMVGGAVMSTSTSKDLSGSVTVKFLLMSKTKRIEEHDRSSAAFGTISLNAYDTLDKWDTNTKAIGTASYASAVRAAEENRLRGWSLPRRLDEKATALGLDLKAEQAVSWESCEKVFQAGMVVELLLLPYASLREYAEVILAPPK